AQDFDGDLAEVMIYNRVLNDAQRILVENYLGAKYGIAVTNERYTHDATYGFDVAGVGQEDASNFHAGASAGIITVSDPQSLENGDYLLYGHDNAGFADWTSDTNVPNVSTQRIPQEWVFEETGDIGQFTITVDIAGLPGTSVGFDSYALLLDDDGDFTSGATYVALSNTTGSLYEVVNVSMTGTTYVTVASVEYITNGSGNFNAAGSWFAGVLPGSGQTAVITDGDAMVLTADMTLGSLVIGTGASLDLDGYTLTLDDGCISGAGTFDVSDPGSTISYAAASDQCVTSGTYHHIRLEGGGIKSLAGAITVAGDLLIADPGVTLDVTTSNHSIDLAGDWTNNGTFSAQNGTVQFVGTGDQTINSSAIESFYGLGINNTGGDILLNSSIRVTHTITLTNGDLVLGSNDLTLTSATTVVGGGTGSYIQADNTGLVEQSIAAPGAFTFPVGDDDEYSPFMFTLNAATVSSAAVFLNLRDLVHPQVTDVAISRYWTLTQSGLSGAIDYDVSFTYTDTDVLRADEGDFEGAKFSSGATTVSGSTDAATNTVTMTTLGSFSDFTATGAGALLPIELLEFKARVEDQTAVLNWSTASELDNDYFTIERSYDWENFEAIGTLEGAGNSEQILHYQFVDRDPLPGVSYYRLKQTDFDGGFTYSNLVMLEYEVSTVSETQISVYPNPTSVAEGLEVVIAGLPPGALIEVKMVAMDGREVHMISGPANAAGVFEKKMALPPNAVRGTYIIYVLSDNERHFERVIVR
ncbi:MAG: T9SS type A sorting domain-containing protein, partial [Bacteroidota bacterium]